MRRLLVACAVSVSLVLATACESSSSTPSTTPAPSAVFDDTELAEIVTEIVVRMQPSAVADQMFGVYGNQATGTGEVNYSRPLVDLRAAVESLLGTPVTWSSWEPGVGALLLGQPIARGATDLTLPYTWACTYDVTGPEPLCGSGGYVEMAFEDGHWKFETNVETWIS